MIQYMTSDEILPGSLKISSFLGGGGGGGLTNPHWSGNRSGKSKQVAMCVWPKCSSSKSWSKNKQKKIRECPKSEKKRESAKNRSFEHSDFGIQSHNLTSKNRTNNASLDHFIYKKILNMYTYNGLG